jgi:hypothetical protein
MLTVLNNIPRDTLMSNQFTLVRTLAGLATLSFALLSACSDVSAPFSSLKSGPAAFSGTNSGGVNSGGVNSGGVNSGGGGGGAGGGSTTPSSTSCAVITSYGNSTGYYSVWAAIWTSFSYTNSCGDQVTMTMTYLNGNTGLVDFQRSSSVMRNGTIDEDWAAFSTPYTVTMTLTDAAGNVLDMRSAVVTTKVPKSLTGG